jgi:hypothetical protein
MSSHGHKKAVKNRASNRKVPIHPFLVQIGFLDCVATRKAETTDGRVFPAFRYSRFFNETLLERELRIKQPDICFHSFRHCFKDALRNATSDLEARDRLCGHNVEGMSGAYGEKFVSLKQAAAIVKEQFPVDLAQSVTVKQPAAGNRAYGFPSASRSTPQRALNPAGGAATPAARGRGPVVNRV